MTARFALVALAFAALAVPAARAQVAPRDIWPQATSLAREGDFDAASKKTTELLNTGRTYGIKTFPLYAASASGLAGQSE